MPDTVKKIVDAAIAANGGGGMIPRPNDAIIWINEAMDKLGEKYDTALVVNSADLTYATTQEGTRYALPATCVAVIGVKEISSNAITPEYTVDEYQRIGFKYAGSYSVSYLRLPDRTTHIDYSDDLEINPLYHNAISRYVAFMYLKAHGLEQTLQQAYEAEFYDMAANAHKRLIQMKRKHIRIPSRKWR